MLPYWSVSLLEFTSITQTKSSGLFIGRGVAAYLLYSFAAPLSFSTKDPRHSFVSVSQSSFRKFRRKRWNRFIALLLSLSSYRRLKIVLVDSDNLLTGSMAQWWNTYHSMFEVPWRLVRLILSIYTWMFLPHFWYSDLLLSPHPNSLFYLEENQSSLAVDGIL